MSQTNELQLPAVLDLTAAAPLAQSILSLRGSDLSIDGSRVQRVGTQCLQVLLAAAATWRMDGLRLEVASPSEELIEGSRMLGIQLNDNTHE